ncbi:reverse transcriptase family protein [Marinicellulosiphila megalodicopiae]|uniref:reverse transcriptase family protein n=1 Tax=Marinicellulosiphila megalodicopiae TaxID=2724896 RepID=UPI003BAEE907
MNQKRKYKLKIDSKNKSYAIKDSIFYKLNSKKKLAEILHTTLPKLNALRSNENYHEFMDHSGKKPRLIQKPINDLEVIHTRIASLLVRITTPSYLHSGVKLRSHITNASSHLDSEDVMTADIRSFYSSTKKTHIYNFFHKTLKASPDVSGLLAIICSFNEFVPTGSRLSMPIAFWANYPMFTKINNLALLHKLNFSLYVDDLTFSGSTIPQDFELNIRNIVKSYGHNLHPKKTNFYNKTQFKIVTGVAIKDGKLFVSNKLHKSIFQDIELWKAGGMCYFEDLHNRLVGKLNSQAQIDPKLKNKIISIRKKIREEEGA